MQGASQISCIVWTTNYGLCMSPDCIAPEEILARIRYGLAAFENRHGYSIIIPARVKIKATIEVAGWGFFFEYQYSLVLAIVKP